MQRDEWADTGTPWRRSPSPTPWAIRPSSRTETSTGSAAAMVLSRRKRRDGQSSNTSI